MGLVGQKHLHLTNCFFLGGFSIEMYSFILAVLQITFAKSLYFSCRLTIGNIQIPNSTTITKRWVKVGFLDQFTIVLCPQHNM